MRKFRVVTPFIVAMLVLTACPASDGDGGDGDGDGDGDGALGGTISILAVYADAEEESFMAMIEPWATENGVEIEYTATRAINAQLTTQIAGGNPPDIAGLPGPGAMIQFARDGDLVALDDVIDMDAYSSQYDEGWITAGTVDEQLVGIFTKVSVKGLIFYNPAQFEAEGYTVPEDFDGLTSLVDEISASGTPPWGIAIEDGAATAGRRRTDRGLVLRQSGPTLRPVGRGHAPVVEPGDHRGVRGVRRLATDEAFVAGGPNQVINTAFGNGGDCLLSEPAECYLHHQGASSPASSRTTSPMSRGRRDVRVLPDARDRVRRRDDGRDCSACSTTRRRPAR